MCITLFSNFFQYLWGMAVIYKYLLAPNTPNNLAVLQQALIDFPDLVDNQQIGNAYPKSSADVLREDGSPMLKASEEVCLYVKANESEIDPSLIENITDLQIFDADNQPKDTFWLNVE